ncbi:MAG TPA: hypothetical protein VJL89_07150 [Thermodesulfovibrionia bacterium]|nr:hypothetical protein [Thermodesulfovibrionia bacterium]
MEKPDLTYWDYVKAAFNLRVSMSVFGSIPLNKLILTGFAILGFGNVGFWFLGLAYEAAYLMILSGNGRFQTLIKGRKLQEHNQAFVEKKQQFYAGLDNQSRLRYDQLTTRCNQILKSAQQLHGQGGKTELESEGLEQLQLIFLKLLNTRLKIRKTLEEINKKDLETEVKQLNKKIADAQPDSSIYRSLTGTLEILERRLLNLKKADENLAVTDAELNRIENQVNLLKEEIATTTDADFLSLRLDGVLDSIQSTAKWIADNVEIFGSDE